jgi:hypothetical protein
MPETILFNPMDLATAEHLLKKKRRVVFKRRVGRGGRNFRVVTESNLLSSLNREGHPSLLQEHIESKINGYVFSIRSVAFGGEFMCMYANLSHRPFSNHGILTFVAQGDRFGLADQEFKTEFYNQRSWEAGIWFGESDPPYLRHNLYEDEVARTTLYLPEPLHIRIKELSVEIERFYEALNLTSLPEACFEKIS